MMLRGPKPSLSIATPALAYLVFETWLWWSDPGAPKTLRFAIAAALIVGVLYEHRVVLALWALYNIFGAMIFTVWSLRAAGQAAPQALLLTAFAAAALINTGYLFFFHSPRPPAPAGSV